MQAIVYKNSKFLEKDSLYINKQFEFLNTKYIDLSK